MEVKDIEERLSRSITEKEVKEFCHEAESKPEMAPVLFEIMRGNDKRAAANAAWVMTHLPKKGMEFLASHQNELIDIAMGEKESVALKRLTLNLINEQKFEEESLRAEFIDFCLETMMNVKETPGVRSLCIKVGYKQCSLYEELMGEFMQYVEMLREQTTVPAISCSVKNVMKEWEKRRGKRR